MHACMYVCNSFMHTYECMCGFLDFHLHVTVLTNLLLTCIQTNLCMVGLGRIRLGNFSESDRLAPPPSIEQLHFNDVPVSTWFLCMYVCAYMRMHVNALVFVGVYHVQWLTAFSTEVHDFLEKNKFKRQGLKLNI